MQVNLCTVNQSTNSTKENRCSVVLDVDEEFPARVVNFAGFTSDRNTGQRDLALTACHGVCDCGLYVLSHCGPNDPNSYVVSDPAFALGTFNIPVRSDSQKMCCDFAHSALELLCIA